MPKAPPFADHTESVGENTAHKDGFDSRYAAIGWICAKRILGVGRPIL